MYVEQKYYDVLNAKRNDNLDGIEKKYKSLAEEYKSLNNSAKFERINVAWVKISQFHEEEINRVKRVDDDADFFKEDLLSIIDKEDTGANRYKVLKDEVKNDKITTEDQLEEELFKQHLINIIDKEGVDGYRYGLLIEKVRNNQITSEDQLEEELFKEHLIARVNKESNSNERYKLLRENVKNNQITTEDQLEEELYEISKNRMSKKVLIVGIFGGLWASWCSVLILPESPILAILGIFFSFISIYGVYSTYKQKKYGKVILIITIILLFIFVWQTFYGLLLLIFSLVEPYLKNI